MIEEQPKNRRTTWRARLVGTSLRFAVLTLVLGLVLQFTLLRDFWDGAELPYYPWWIGGPILGLFTVPVTLPILLVGLALRTLAARRRESARANQGTAVQDRNL